CRSPSGFSRSAAACCSCFTRSISATRFSFWARDSEFLSTPATSISGCAIAAAPGSRCEGRGRNVVVCAADDAPVAAGTPGSMVWLPQERRVVCSRYVRRTLEAAMTSTVATTSQRHAAAGAIEVIPTGRALGAEVRGVDLRDLDEAAFARLMQA